MLYKCNMLSRYNTWTNYEWQKCDVNDPEEGYPLAKKPSKLTPATDTNGKPPHPSQRAHPNVAKQRNPKVPLC
jgi:hypothetical protein